MKGALIHAMNAGFIAAEEMKFGAGRQSGKCSGHAIRRVRIMADFYRRAAHPGSHGPIEEMLLDCPEAAQTPDAGNHLFDRGKLDIVGGGEFVDMLL